MAEMHLVTLRVGALEKTMEDIKFDVNTLGKDDEDRLKEKDTKDAKAAAALSKKRSLKRECSDSMSSSEDDEDSDRDTEEEREERSKKVKRVVSDSSSDNSEEEAFSSKKQSSASRGVSKSSSGAAASTRRKRSSSSKKTSKITEFARVNARPPYEIAESSSLWQARIDELQSNISKADPVSLPFVGSNVCRPRDPILADLKVLFLCLLCCAKALKMRG